MRERDGWMKWAIPVLFGAALILRVLALPLSNVDMTIIERWYDFIVENGVRRGLSDVYSNYPPAYEYLLILATLTNAFIPKLTAIKLIPIMFDGFAAYLVYKLVRLQYPEGRKPLFASALFLVLPTVLMNGSVWGQIDILYGSFLLLCLYFLLSGRPVAAMLAYAVSFSIKGQAIFLLPFILVLTVKKRIPMWTFGLIPLVYALLAVPALIAGRGLAEVMSLYLGRVELFDDLAMHAPNLYSLVTLPYFKIATYAGLTIAAVSILTWTVYYGWHRFELSPRLILLTALGSAVLMPFVLPKMHDRFFFPADLTSFVLAFFWPSFWFVAAGYQLISGLVYFIFLHSVTTEQNQAILYTAVLLNTVMVVHVLIRQYFLTRTSEP